MSVLELRGVSARYDRATVLHRIDLSVQEGGATALLGSNGAGKTTTLRAISGMVRTTGAVELFGSSLVGRRPHQVARLGVAHVPEGRGTIPQLTVAENLLVGAYGARDRAQVAADRAMCLDMFPSLSRRLRSRAGNLSGGEQQMLAISRALMSRPKLLLLDEPSLGLAPSTAELVYETIRRLRAATGIALLIVEQNAALALSVADQAVVLDSGSVALSGPASELAGRDDVRRAYLG